jgi:beta-N-acetylhexosaminidase
MSLGPLMLDLRALSMQSEEREMLLHPLVGGVILFTRNYADPEQITELISTIHALREPRLLVGVDHEGGAVQRFRPGFTTLPACATFGRWYARDRSQAIQASRAAGWLMAAELRAVGVDFSFAPVLDLGLGISRVVKDRAFHGDPLVVSELAKAYITGMREAGMAAVGKHFPGHGSVAPDSHHEIPVDPREFADIEQADLIPFAALIRDGLNAIMPAHVIYSQVDPQPAGFSAFWLQEVARGRLGFRGAIFSDDLSMAGAAVVGNVTERVRCALTAGCDMALVCNHPDAAAQVLSEFGSYTDRQATSRLLQMQGRNDSCRAELLTSERWGRAVALLDPDALAPDLAANTDG